MSGYSVTLFIFAMSVLGGLWIVTIETAKTDGWGLALIFLVINVLAWAVIFLAVVGIVALSSYRI